MGAHPHKRVCVCARLCCVEQTKIHQLRQSADKCVCVRVCVCVFVHAYLREVLDEIMGVGFAAGVLDLGLRDPVPAVPDVLSDRCAEQNRLLTHYT